MQLNHGGKTPPTGAPCDNYEGRHDTTDPLHATPKGRHMATVLSSYRQDRLQLPIVGAVGILILAYTGWLALNTATPHTVVHESAHHAAESAPVVHADPPSLYSVLPFAALLLAIAVLPLLETTRHWWESNRSRFLVAATLGG